MSTNEPATEPAQAEPAPAKTEPNKEPQQRSGLPSWAVQGLVAAGRY